MTASAERLRSVLERARTLGFLGPGPVAAHIAHSAGFGEVLEHTLGCVPRSLLDLGSGGGVPALVLGVRWPDTPMVLVESVRRRAEFLRSAVGELELTSASVAETRAELLAHEPGSRERFHAVTARGFAEPAATAEIGAGFVETGGVLVVSEPPNRRPERWSVTGLAEFGFAEPFYQEVHGHFVAIRKLRSPGPGIPRGIGRPVKRPRW